MLCESATIVGNEQELPALEVQHHVDVACPPVHNRVHDRLAGDTHNLFALSWVEIRATGKGGVRHGPDVHVHVEAGSELVGDQTKRCPCRRRRTCGQVRNDASRCVERTSSGDYQWMIGTEVGFESLRVGPDERQILRQPIVQIARQTLSLLIQRRRRPLAPHRGIPPERDSQQQPVRGKPQSVTGSHPIGGFLWCRQILEFGCREQ
jgi:hypothetical protein